MTLRDEIAVGESQSFGAYAAIQVRSAKKPASFQVGQLVSATEWSLAGSPTMRAGYTNGFANYQLLQG